MNKPDFLHVSLGIDVSKDDFHVCLTGVLADKTQKILSSARFGNTANGFDKFWAWVNQHIAEQLTQVIFVMEATGVYHENLAWFLYEKQVKVSIVLPNQAKAFLKSEGFKSKTDKIDAQGLSRMGLVKNLRLWKPISPILHQLRTQTRYYEALQKELTRCKNRSHALLYSHEPDELTLTLLKQHLTFLAEQVKATKQSIVQIVCSDAKLYAKIQHIIKTPGLQILTVAVIVAETNGFELFTSQKQLTSFAGYDVVENQSGKHYGKTRISKQGNTHIRRALGLPSVNAVKRPKAHNSFKDLYIRVFERTKLKWKAYTAVQRKLLCLIYTLWKKDEDFDPKKDVKKVEEPIALLHEIVTI